MELLHHHDTVHIGGDLFSGHDTSNLLGHDGHGILHHHTTTTDDAPTTTVINTVAHHPTASIASNHWHTSGGINVGNGGYHVQGGLTYQGDHAHVGVEAGHSGSLSGGKGSNDVTICAGVNW